MVLTVQLDNVYDVVVGTHTDHGNHLASVISGIDELKAPQAQGDQLVLGTPRGLIGTLGDS